MTPTNAAPTSRQAPGVRRRTLLQAASLAPMLAPCALVRAQERWPARPVTIISPYNPGGTNDVVARLLAERLQKVLGQPFVVENKPGAAGIVGAQLVMRAKPDGYTLLSANNGALIIQTAGRPVPPFDPVKQLTPIVKLVDAAQFIGISSELPARTVGEFITHARQNPGKLNYSSAGIGSFGHFMVEYLKMVAGLDIVHVPAKGSPAGVLEMLAGRIQLMIDPQILSNITDPRIRVLATLNSQRVEAYPQLPTIVESGGPALDLTGWFGLLGPAGLPTEVTERIAAVGRELVQDPEARKILQTSGLLPALLAGKEFGDLMAGDLRKVADIRVRAKIDLS
ncbi:MAG: tripartite tricarboxylate transporter substrate binding protein [Rhodoferax sp.]